MISLSKFLKLESKYKLFELKNKKNDFYWDFIRYAIGFRLTINHSKDQIFSNELAKKGRIIFALVCDLFVLFLNIFKKKKYIIIHAGRNDLLNTYLDALGLENCFLINFKNQIDLGLNSITISIVSLLNKINYNTKKNITLIKPHDFTKIFGSDFEQLSKKLLIKHYNEEIFFKFIYNLLKPKSIFFMNFGSKSMITAAKKRKIKIFEIQHGEITNLSLINHYPNNINKRNIYFPDKFFLFSKYWSYTNYNTKKISIGSQKKLSKYYPKKNKIKNIVFAMNLSNEDFFCEIIEKIKFKLKNKIKITVKPHPMYPEREYYYKKKFKNFDKIRILDAKKKFTDVIENCSIIVTSYSTVIYEGLDSGRIVACDYLSYPLCNKKLYELNHSNFYYFKNCNELFKIINKEIKKSQNKFHDKFDKEILLSNI